MKSRIVTFEAKLFQICHEIMDSKCKRIENCFSVAGHMKFDSGSKELLDTYTLYCKGIISAQNNILAGSRVIHNDFGFEQKSKKDLCDFHVSRRAVQVLIKTCFYVELCTLSLSSAEIVTCFSTGRSKIYSTKYVV